MEYTRISILDIVEGIGEDRCKNILSLFSCPLNRGVEDFIRNKALNFAQQKVAVTFSQKNYWREHTWFKC